MQITSDSQRLWVYNCLDCVTTAKVDAAISEELTDLNTASFYDGVAHPLTLAVHRMAKRGMHVDQTRLRRLQTVMDERIRRYELVLGDIVGHEFNPRSGDDVRKYLFEELRLKPVGKPTKTGKASVDELALLKLGMKHDSPFFKVLLGHRKMQKLRSTYLTKVYIYPDGRVRSRFLVHGTGTGRLSSRDPNLQNIPQQKDVWYGLKLLNLRTMYVATPGRVFVEADSSQLELRLIALASRCAALIEAFELKHDVHRLNASAIYGKRLEDITKEERDFAKRFVYCQNYGGSPRRISEILFEEAGIIKSPLECEATLLLLKHVYPEIYSWRDRQLEAAKLTRRITNEFGRVRITFTKDDDLAGVAYNTPIQSTAADYINLAFIRMDARGLELVNQVHDSVLVECDVSDVTKTIAAVKEELERPVDIFGQKGVVLPCDIKVGVRWGALKKWEG